MNERKDENPVVVHAIDQAVGRDDHLAQIGPLCFREYPPGHWKECESADASDDSRGKLVRGT